MLARRKRGKRGVEGLADSDSEIPLAIVTAYYAVHGMVMGIA